MASKNVLPATPSAQKPSRNNAYAENYDRIFRNNICAYCEERLLDGEGVPYKGRNTIPSVEMWLRGVMAAKSRKVCFDIESSGLLDDSTQGLHSISLGVA